MTTTFHLLIIGNYTIIITVEMADFACAYVCSILPCFLDVPTQQLCWMFSKCFNFKFWHAHPQASSSGVDSEHSQSSNNQNGGTIYYVPCYIVYRNI